MDRTVTKIEFTKPISVKRKRVAAYARVSSEKDAMQHSLSAQVSYYSGMIQNRRDWEYAGVYADEGLTGTKSSRPEFQRLISDCKAGKIDMIIAKSISRFARNTVTLLETVRMLKNIGINVYFEEQNIDSVSSDGELMISILASYAQEESLSVSENCKWRIRENFRNGIPCSMRIFGYDFTNNKLVINPSEADIVKMIFQDYIGGNGSTKIAKKLCEMGIHTVNKKQWDAKAILRLINNEKYTGNMLLQKTFRENHLTKAKRINKGELPMYHVENSHEAIIDANTFNKAQEILLSRQRKYTNKHEPVSDYPFTGIITCAKCGKTYRRKLSNVGTKYERPVWICTTFNTLGKSHCASKQIPDDILSEITAELIQAECTAETVKQHIREIIADGSFLTFILLNGTRTTREWQNKSRSERWTVEMKQKAREEAMRKGTKNEHSN